jgi:amino acid transporter
MQILGLCLLAVLIGLALFLRLQSERLRRRSPRVLAILRVAVVVLALGIVVIFLPGFAGP